MNPIEIASSTVQSHARWLARKSKRRFAQPFTLLALTLLLGLAGFPAGLALATATPPDFGAIDAYIAAQMKAIGIPGLGVRNVFILAGVVSVLAGLLAVRLFRATPSDH